MTQELLYRGPLMLDQGAGDPTPVEVWRTGSTAVAFQGDNPVGVLKDVRAELDQGRLLLRGNQPDGAGPARWLAPNPPIPQGRWSGVAVAWPDGRISQGAQVEWSQYAVTVTSDSEPTVVLAGARTEVVGQDRWIVDGAVRIPAQVGRPGGCGCGG